MIIFQEREERVDVVQSENGIGKTLVSKRRMEKGEVFFFWGKRVKKGEIDEKSRDYVLTCRRKIIDPTRCAESVLQFANCPGKDELPCLYITNTIVEGRREKTGEKMIGAKAVLTTEVEKGQQLTYWYGKGWFEERGIERRNVGSDLFPCRRRKRTRESGEGENCEWSSSLLRSSTCASSCRKEGRTPLNRGNMILWKEERREGRGRRRG